MGELQEYGDNYYRWLRQGQGLESSESEELISGSDGNGDDGDAVSRIASGNGNNVAGGDDSAGDVSATGGSTLSRVGGGVDGDDDASCPDIGFVFDPDGQVPNTLHVVFPRYTHYGPTILMLTIAFIHSLTYPLTHPLTRSLVCLSLQQCVVLGPQLMVSHEEQHQLSVLAKRLGLDEREKQNVEGKELEAKAKENEGEKVEGNEGNEVKWVDLTTAVEEEEDGVCMMLRWLVWLQHVNTPSGRDDLMALVHSAKNQGSSQQGVVNGADNDNDKDQKDQGWDKGLDKGQDKDKDQGYVNGSVKDKDQGLGQGLLGVNDLLHMVWVTHGRALRLETAVEVNTPLLKVTTYLRHKTITSW